jgi:hypothetical protein
MSGAEAGVSATWLASAYASRRFQPSRHRLRADDDADLKRLDLRFTPTTSGDRALPEVRIPGGGHMPLPTRFRGENASACSPWRGCSRDG